jgi:hypothetical protein
LTEGGFNDWRLPDPLELSTILDYASTDESAINMIAFPIKKIPLSPVFWSSATSHDYNKATVVSFESGEINFMPKNNFIIFARCIRGDNFFTEFDVPVRFFISEPIENQHVVNDFATGLIWMKTDLQVFWPQALANCEGQNYAGFSDWRLPNVNELITLLSYHNHYAFIDIPYDYYASTSWASSSMGQYGGLAFSVFFSEGIVGTSWKVDSARGVMCVRN